MFTQHHNRTRTVATATLFTLAAFATAVRADFAVGGSDNTGPYVNDNNILVFDGEDAVDAFVTQAVHTATLADMLAGDETDEQIVDIALETAGNALGFSSLATQLIDYENGTVSESDLNIDAFRVTDWTQQRLLNPDLEIQIGGSIYKVMGDAVVEITDADAATVEWLRAVQQTRREIQAETDYADPDVRWLSDSADNVIVHGWQQTTNRPEAEQADDGMTQNYSTPLVDDNSPDYERDAGSLPQFFSEPQQIGGTAPEMEIATDGMTQNYSEPVQDDTNDGPAMERASLGDGLAYQE